LHVNEENENNKVSADLFIPGLGIKTITRFPTTFRISGFPASSAIHTPFFSGVKFLQPIQNAVIIESSDSLVSL